MAAIIIPRNFKLLEEVRLQLKIFLSLLWYISSTQLEASEKGTGDMSVSMGLVNSDDIFLTEWQGSIMGPHGVRRKLKFIYWFNHLWESLQPQTVFDSRFYELRMTCGPDYPAVPPKVRFVSKINLTGINQSNGNVDNSFPAMANWTRNSTIESVLVGIKNAMLAPQNKRLPQPAEGTNF